jgi:hypothetical protein
MPIYYQSQYELTDYEPVGISGEVLTAFLVFRLSGYMSALFECGPLGFRIENAMQASNDWIHTEFCVQASTEYQRNFFDDTFIAEEFANLSVLTIRMDVMRNLVVRKNGTLRGTATVNTFPSWAWYSKLAFGLQVWRELWTAEGYLDVAAQLIFSKALSDAECAAIENILIARTGVVV